MPIVYGTPLSPFVRKVMVALAEKAMPYDFELVVPINPTPEYKKISPLGKVPAFRDGDRSLCDSSVIIAYLEKVKPDPALYPSDAYDYARALWFEEFGDGGLSPIVGAKIFRPTITAKITKQQADVAAIGKVVSEELPPLFDYLEGEIDGKEWLVSNRFSIADIGVATQFVNLQLAGYGVDAKRWPKLSAYVSRAHARTSFSDAIGKAKAAIPN
jgi:glutathione S-transferase